MSNGIIHGTSWFNEYTFVNMHFCPQDLTLGLMLMAKEIIHIIHMLLMLSKFIGINTILQFGIHI